MVKKMAVSSLLLASIVVTAHAFDFGMLVPTRLEPAAEISDPPPGDVLELAARENTDDGEGEESAADESSADESTPEEADSQIEQSEDENDNLAKDTEEELIGEEMGTPVVETITDVEIADELEDLPPPPPPSRKSSGHILSDLDLGQFTDRMEADRRLLSEIRKNVPDIRREAESYLDRLKNLASLSDPVRLVPLANRVLSNATIYFDWLDRDFADENERAMEYYVGGARGFNIALETFKSAVMFTIINRLDVAAKLINELNIGPLN